MQPYYNEKGHLVIHFKNYSVVQKDKNFNAIYYEGEFLCHKDNWKSATKMAKMLQKAFDEGFARGSY